MDRLSETIDFCHCSRLRYSICQHLQNVLPNRSVHDGPDWYWSEPKAVGTSIFRYPHAWLQGGRSWTGPASESVSVVARVRWMHPSRGTVTVNAPESMHWTRLKNNKNGRQRNTSWIPNKEEIARKPELAGSEKTGNIPAATRKYSRWTLERFRRDR